MIATFHSFQGETQSALASSRQSETSTDAAGIMSLFPETRGFRCSSLSGSGLTLPVDVVDYFSQYSDFIGGGESYLLREPADARRPTYVDRPERFSSIRRRTEVLSPSDFEGSEVATADIQQVPIGVGYFQTITNMYVTSSGADSVGGCTKVSRPFPIEESAQPSGHEVLSLLHYQNDFINLQPTLGGL